MKGESAVQIILSKGSNLQATNITVVQPSNLLANRSTFGYSSRPISNPISPHLTCIQAKKRAKACKSGGPATVSLPSSSHAHSPCLLEGRYLLAGQHHDPNNYIITNEGHSQKSTQTIITVQNSPILQNKQLKDLVTGNHSYITCKAPCMMQPTTHLPRSQSTRRKAHVLETSTSSISLWMLVVVLLQCTHWRQVVHRFIILHSVIHVRCAGSLPATYCCRVRLVEVS